MKLIFVDAERDRFDPAIWKEIRLYTEKEYLGDQFSGLSFGSEEYEEIGFNVISRLCALAKLGPVSKRSPKMVRRKRG